MQRQAAADSRARKTGRTAEEMRALWRVEAATVGVTPASLRRSIEAAAADHPPTTPELTTTTVIDALALGAPTWHRADVCPAMTADVRLVAHTTERDAHVLSTQ